MSDPIRIQQCLFPLAFRLQRVKQFERISNCEAAVFISGQEVLVAPST